MRESKDLGLPGRAVSLPALMVCYIGSCETLLHISYGMSTSDSKQNTGSLLYAQEKMLSYCFSFNTLVGHYHQVAALATEAVIISQTAPGIA
jgi:hypothetical protein